MKTHNLKHSLYALALAGTFCASALSAQLPELPSVVVRFADLNLDRTEGARELYARIRRAVGRVCGPTAGASEGGSYRDWKLCYRLTLDAAVQRIDRPALNALHQRHSVVRLADRGNSG